MVSKTPQTKINVPAGYISVHYKWKGSSLADELKRKSERCYFEDLGVVDFMPSSSCPVVYLNEADVLCTASSITKIKSLAKEYPRCRCVTIIIQNTSTLEAFHEIQMMAVLHYSMTVMPLASQHHLLEFLLLMVKMETTSPVNPYKFKKRKLETRTDRDQQIALLSTIPGVRDTKALRLLKTFGTITAISNASTAKLAEVVGNAVAKSVTEFLHGGGDRGKSK